MHPVAFLTVFIGFTISQYTRNFHSPKLVNNNDFLQNYTKFTHADCSIGRVLKWVGRINVSQCAQSCDRERNCGSFHYSPCGSWKLCQLRDYRCSQADLMKTFNSCSVYYTKKEQPKSIRKPIQLPNAPKPQIVWRNQQQFNSSTTVGRQKVESNRRLLRPTITVKPTRTYTRRREMTLIDPNKRPTLKPPVVVPLRRLIIRKMPPRNFLTTTLRPRSYYFETTTIRRVMDDPFADVYNQRRDRNRVRVRDLKLPKPIGGGQTPLVAETTTTEPKEDSEESSEETEDSATYTTTEMNRNLVIYMCLNPVPYVDLGIYMCNPDLPACKCPYTCRQSYVPTTIRCFPARCRTNNPFAVAVKTTECQQCVAALYALCNIPYGTSNWRRGPPVVSNGRCNLFVPFAPIATMPNGTYPADGTGHAAIFLECEEDGILVADQWCSQSFEVRTIPFNAEVNDPSTYYVIS